MASPAFSRCKKPCRTSPLPNSAVSHIADAQLFANPCNVHKAELTWSSQRTRVLNLHALFFFFFIFWHGVAEMNQVGSWMGCCKQASQPREANQSGD